MTLERAYRSAARIIGSARVECEEAAHAVEELRLRQRPDAVRVVLLAESHVYTSASEISSRVELPDLPGTAFARFVYCLGYGETERVTPPVSPNAGTWQYWRLFCDCLYPPGNRHRNLQRGGEPNGRRRIKNKLGLLAELQAAGIWLIDASVTALYCPRPGGTPEKLAVGGNYAKLLRECWDAHVGEVLTGCAPAAVLIIGKGVDATIGGTVRHTLGPGVEVLAINQPNARQKDGGKAARQTVHDLCARHRWRPPSPEPSSPSS